MATRKRGKPVSLSNKNKPEVTGPVHFVSSRKLEQEAAGNDDQPARETRKRRSESQDQPKAENKPQRTSTRLMKNDVEDSPKLAKSKRKHITQSSENAKPGSKKDDVYDASAVGKKGTKQEKSKGSSSKPVAKKSQEDNDLAHQKSNVPKKNTRKSVAKKEPTKEMVEKESEQQSVQKSGNSQKEVVEQKTGFERRGPVRQRVVKSAAELLGLSPRTARKKTSDAQTKTNVNKNPKSAPSTDNNLFSGKEHDKHRHNKKVKHVDALSNNEKSQTSIETDSRNSSNKNTNNKTKIITKVEKQTDLPNPPEDVRTKADAESASEEMDKEGTQGVAAPIFVLTDESKVDSLQIISESGEASGKGGVVTYQVHLDDSSPRDKTKGKHTYTGSMNQSRNLDTFENGQNSQENFNHDGSLTVAAAADDVFTVTVTKTTPQASSAEGSNGYLDKSSLGDGTFKEQFVNEVDSNYTSFMNNSDQGTKLVEDEDILLTSANGNEVVDTSCLDSEATNSTTMPVLVQPITDTDNLEPVQVIPYDFDVENDEHLVDPLSSNIATVVQIRPVLQQQSEQTEDETSQTEPEKNNPSPQADYDSMDFTMQIKIVKDKDGTMMLHLPWSEGELGEGIQNAMQVAKFAMENGLLDDQKEVHTVQTSTEDLNKKYKMKQKAYLPEKSAKRTADLTQLSEPLQKLVIAVKPQGDIEKHVTFIPVPHSNQPEMLCNYCNRTLRSKGEFKQHIINHPHIEYRPWICPVCQYACSMRAILIRHMGIHEEVKPFVCQECGRGFNFKQKLKLHMKYHNDIRDKPCPLCDMAFHEHKTRKTHLMKMHNIKKVKVFKGEGILQLTMPDDKIIEVQPNGKKTKLPEIDETSVFAKKVQSRSKKSEEPKLQDAATTDKSTDAKGPHTDVNSTSQIMYRDNRVVVKLAVQTEVPDPAFYEDITPVIDAEYLEVVPEDTHYLCERSGKLVNLKTQSVIVVEPIDDLNNAATEKYKQRSLLKDLQPSIESSISSSQNQQPSVESSISSVQWEISQDGDLAVEGLIGVMNSDGIVNPLIKEETVATVLDSVEDDPHLSRVIQGFTSVQNNEYETVKIELSNLNENSNSKSVRSSVLQRTLPSKSCILGTRKTNKYTSQYKSGLVAVSVLNDKETIAKHQNIEKAKKKKVPTATLR